MTIDFFLNKLKLTPNEVKFEDTMNTIEANFHFTPTKFKNGNTTNEVGENSGSCKLFAFAQHQKLTPEETLCCFGQYYRKDVLENPDGTDHQNIRNFITHGWNGIDFEGTPLKIK